MLTACSTQNIKKDTNITAPVILNLQEPVFENSKSLGGHFSGNFKLMDFIDRMHNEHNFDYNYLYKLFSNAQDINQVVEPCTSRDKNGRCIIPVKPQGKWDRYRGMFIYERNIDRGVAFWNEHENALNKAYQVYGVLPEFIIGILGVETAYGVNFGKKKVIDVLTSKAMLGDRREDFYTSQLEKFLVMTRDSGLDASTLMGSNAGAMGYGQFIASSYLAFAVDFNEDGVTDLWNAEDAIGSIANYFSRNGWNRNIRQVAVRAKYRGNRFKRLKTGYKTKYSQYKLRKKYHIVPRTKLSYRGPVSLIKLPKYAYDELWFGTHNFRVITTYNHSTFYGMAVFQLGQAVKARRYGR
jgi:membrane-bound lytic murein transglycosylase B